MEPIAEVRCQDAKWASGREMAWAGPGGREGGRSPGSCWVRGAVKDFGDGAWGLRQRSSVEEGIVLSFLLSQVEPLRRLPP